MLAVHVNVTYASVSCDHPPHQRIAIPITNCRAMNWFNINSHSFLAQWHDTAISTRPKFCTSIHTHIAKNCRILRSRKIGRERVALVPMKLVCLDMMKLLILLKHKKIEISFTTQNNAKNNAGQRINSCRSILVSWSTTIVLWRRPNNALSNVLKSGWDVAVLQYYLCRLRSTDLLSAVYGLRSTVNCLYSLQYSRKNLWDRYKNSKLRHNSILFNFSEKNECIITLNQGTIWSKMFSSSIIYFSNTQRFYNEFMSLYGLHSWFVVTSKSLLGFKDTLNGILNTSLIIRTIAH